MTRISFSRPDGEHCSGYLAEPNTSNGRAIVVAHELWGVTAPMCEVADRLAGLGYRALVPDLFRGQCAKGLEHGLELMAQLDWVSAAKEDLRGAAQWLGRGDAAVAVLGFCMGGALSILAAEFVPELSAAVCFYGVPPAELSNPGRIRVPLLGHFAERDDWCTPAKVAALEARLVEAGARFELHRYDASHAFMNPTGSGYSKQAADVAWSRTLDFLERTLSSRTSR